jgi:hypothetical protein
LMSTAELTADRAGISGATLSDDHCAAHIFNPLGSQRLKLSARCPARLG